MGRRSNASLRREAGGPHSERGANDLSALFDEIKTPAAAEAPTGGDYGRTTGTILTFMPQGFGFIQGQRDRFFYHISQLPAEMQAGGKANIGKTVSFRAVNKVEGKKPEAMDIRLVE